MSLMQMSLFGGVAAGSWIRGHLAELSGPPAVRRLIERREVAFAAGEHNDLPHQPIQRQGPLH
jgi:hypothetical protein